VVFTRTTVAEVHSVAVEAVDVGTNAQVALTEMPQNLSVDDWVRLVNLVVGLGESEPHGVAREGLQNPLVDKLFDWPGQWPALVQGVAGSAEYVARHEVVATPDAHIDVLGVVD